MAKLSPAMEKVLNKLIEAPWAEYEKGFEHFHMEDGKTIYTGGYGIHADGSITTIADSKTLRALEKRGLIEIIEDGGEWTDSVRLLKHTNPNRPITETHNMVKMKIYKIGRDGEEVNIQARGGFAYVENGNPENVFGYWIPGVRTQPSRIVNLETGETVYQAK